MNAHTMKALRQQFRAVGKFHTPPELALKLSSYITNHPKRVYDPTCGAGALLSVFPEHVQKYGQDIDAAALDDAAQLPNFHGHLGDVLTDPAWLEERFDAIVANPPFSVGWEPQVDERFMTVPVLPTAGRADYAFLLHILHMLAGDGIAAVLSFPGVLYRGNREKTLRAWLIEQNVIDQVVAIPGKTFEDTAIATAVIVLKKNRPGDAPVLFTDDELDITEQISREQIRQNDYTLSVSQYVAAPEPDIPPFDAWETEQAARRNLLRKLKSELTFSKQVAAFEGWPMEPLYSAVHEVVDEVKEAA